jgi:uncharacterized membrane protein YqjE
MSAYDAPPGSTAAGATSAAATSDTESRSVGDIVGAITKDLSSLIKQELDLAKVELKQEAKQAGKGAGMLGGAGLAGWFTLLFLSVFLMFVLASWFEDYRWAALVVTLLWGVVAAVLALTGKKELQRVDPTLPTTQQTLKEDAQWAREQKSS